MSDKNTKVTVSTYTGGTNAVIEHNGKSVSASKSDNNLYDVQSDKGDYLYTGKNIEEAAKASQDYLKK